MDGRKVVICGAGFGGVKVALELVKLSSDLQVTIINNTPDHSYHPDLYEIVGESNEQGEDSLKKLVTIPLTSIFKNKSVEVVIDTVQKVNLLEKSLTLQGGKKIDYDFLVLALGSNTCYFGIPGAQANSSSLKDATDALQIRADLKKLMAQGEDKIKVMIAGGGFTGVEVAGSLCKYLKILQRKTGRQWSLEIIEAADGVLPGMPPKIRESVAKSLMSNNITLTFNAPIEKIDRNKVYTQSGLKDYDYIIWTTGVEGVALNQGLEDLEISKRKQLTVKKDLSLEKYPNVFAIGDLALFINAKTERPVPATAWAALGQGKKVAQNIVAKVNSKASAEYLPESPMFVIPTGGLNALLSAKGFTIGGLFGWFTKRVVTLQYYLEILPFGEAVGLWGRGLWVFWRNDV